MIPKYHVRHRLYGKNYHRVCSMRIRATWYQRNVTLSCTPLQKNIYKMNKRRLLVVDSLYCVYAFGALSIQHGLSYAFSSLQRFTTYYLTQVTKLRVTTLKLKRNDPKSKLTSPHWFFSFSNILVINQYLDGQLLCLISSHHDPCTVHVKNRMRYCSYLLVTCLECIIILTIAVATFVIVTVVLVIFVTCWF